MAPANSSIPSRIFLSATLSVALLAFGTRLNAQHFPPDEDVLLMLRYLVEDGKAQGIVVGFLEADGSTRVLSYGNPGPGARPLGPRSIFEIGSMEKTFTATLLADMVMKGEVALEEPVSNYLPENWTVPSFGGREITLLELATHRSGLPKNEETHRPADPLNPYADLTLETIRQFLSSYDLSRAPGAGFTYSNLGFQLLGYALGRVAGTGFEALHRERILEPLGMTSAGFTLDGERVEWAARGYRSGSVVPYWTGTEARLGAGGLFANAEDLLEYLDANVGPPTTELERAMRRAQEPRMPWGESGARIGLAWKVDSLQGREIVQHGGNTNGFSSFIGFDQEREVGLVWLTNTYVFDDNTPLELVALGRRPAMDEVRMSPEALASFAGEYRDPSGTPLYVRLEDEGFLTIQSPGRARMRLFPESEHTFTLDRGSVRMVFETRGDGEISGVRMDPSESGEMARRVGSRTPPARAVAAGDVWHGVGFQWKGGYWVFAVGLGGLAFLALLTLLPEVRRVLGKR